MSSHNRRSVGTLVMLITLLAGLAVPVMAQTEPSGSASEDVPTIAGAANPLDAPVLQAGAVLDSIIQSETLWYAVDAGPGQQVGTTFEIVGQPDGPEADETFLVATITDAQRQPIAEGDVDFSGTEDATVSLGPADIPEAGQGTPLLSVALTPAAADSDLEGTTYRLVLTITVAGEALPIPTEEPTDNTTGAVVDPPPEAFVTEAPIPDRAPPNYVIDLLPVIVVALAVGGFAGFELGRRGL